MKKAFVIRLGAFGDMVIITPVLKAIKSLGYYVVLNTGKRGMEALKHNPNVDEFIQYDDDNKPDNLEEYWEKLRTEQDADLFVNFSESIECNVALHPIQPQYNYTKKERLAIANKNYYDATEEWIKTKAVVKGTDDASRLSQLVCQKLPELFFTAEEIQEAQHYIKPNKVNILWQLSGSAKQKVYPWTDFVIGEVLKNYSNVHFITTGDERCQILETLVDAENITNCSGKISVRVAMALTGLVNLVVSPDTGILHASGCYDTPKIGLLGHTTIENITKYFKNDFSLEAECDCAPCLRLIYDFDIQCPIELVTHAAWCMAEGLRPERVYERITSVIGTEAVRRTAGQEASIS